MDSLPLILGFVICFAMLGFIVWKVHAGSIQANLAATLGAIALAAPVLTSFIGRAHVSAEYGGAKIEAWAKEAQEAAEAVSADKRQVDAVAVEVRGVAAELRALDARYRKMVGDTAGMTYLAWSARNQLGMAPPAVESELERLVNGMLIEAYPDEKERTQFVARMKGIAGR